MSTVELSAASLEQSRRLSRGQLVRRRFFRNKLAVVGLFVLAFMFLLAFIGPFFTKHKWDQLDFFICLRLHHANTFSAHRK